MATNDRTFSQRVKRQSTGREELCQTNYQYITPQAALSSQGARMILLYLNCDLLLMLSLNLIFFLLLHFLGNWMFIVNQVDATRQLVRTETCA